MTVNEATWLKQTVELFLQERSKVTLQSAQTFVKANNDWLIAQPSKLTQ
jgi:hypothetical protein